MLPYSKRENEDIKSKCKMGPSLNPERENRPRY